MLGELVMFIEKELGINDTVYNKVEKKISFYESKHLSATYDYELELNSIRMERDIYIAYMTDYTSAQCEYEIETLEEVKELLKHLKAVEDAHQKLENFLKDKKVRY